jgi:hypothetical protein
MSRKLFGLLFLLFCLSCARAGGRQEPAAGTFFQSVSIKFNFSDSQGLELNVADETALLLRPGKKLYWRGDFNVLLKRLWGIDLTLEDLEQLLIRGLIPEAKIKEKGIVVYMETNGKDQSPQMVKIRQNEAILTIKILKNEIRPGSIVLINYDQRFQLAELADVLADD